MNATKTITVTAPRVPGATPAVVAICDTLAEARKVADAFAGRRDLRYQDVVICRDGERVEFAGPAR